MRDLPKCFRSDSDTRVRLVFLIPSLAGGGAERVASALLPYLSHDFELTVVLLEDRRSYPVPEGVRVAVFSGDLSSQIAHIVRIPSNLISLVRLVRKNRVPLVMSFMEQANILNILAARLTGCKALISQRVEPYRQYGDKGLIGGIILRISRLLYPMASHVIAVSAGLREVMLSNYGLAPERITVIPNPVDLACLSDQVTASLPSDIPDRFLLHVGRMRLAHKAQDVILEAFDILHRRHPALALVLVGEGPDRDQIRKQIKRLGLDNAIILTGWQDNVAAFMARAQAFILGSRYEGWPNVLVEAMSCGCPVVATDCRTGPKEILGNNEYGLLVPIDDSVAMAQAIEKLLSSSSTRRHYRIQALRRAKDFRLEVIAARYCNLIHQLIA